ncbi:MAG: histidine kinase, gyrase and HSP90-like ATPase family protein [Betaproteobacteria bacterium]|jgi:signal transduction histidine kinase|nr:histidine kinase, gyrase and HSP90-like ATPase family protein [Betaproteobacteria bacterium]
MLYEFLTENRDELIARCRAKVAKRLAPQASYVELQYGIPLFLEQLIKTLHHENACSFWESHNHSAESPSRPSATGSEIGKSATKHGSELHRRGLTVDQVVHDYGDLCQAVTELAVELNAPIAVGEFHTLNRCLDNAIADAVTEYTRRRDLAVLDQGNQAMTERLSFLAHELRDLLNSAMLAQKALKSGNVGVVGATGASLDRSLEGMRDLIDRSLAEARLTSGLRTRKERI